MFNLLKSFFSSLLAIPRYKLADGTLNPNYGHDAYWWRVRLVTGYIVLTVIVILHMMQFYGYIGDGVASAADVGKNSGWIIGQEIDAADTTICMHQQSDQGVDPQIVNYVAQLERNFREATGQNYTHKPCTLLLKIRR